MLSLNRYFLKLVRMLKAAVCFFGILAVAWSQSTPISQCLYHTAPVPINTYVEGCPTPPCPLPQGQDVVMQIIFRAPYTMRVMTTVATAYILGPLGVPYDLAENAVTCNFLNNTYCPVLADEVVSYTLRMLIESWFPVGTQVTVEFRINDDNGDPITCIRVPISIISGSARGDASPGNTTATIIL